MFNVNDLTEVLDRLEGVEQRNGYAVARCPAHDDEHPSLSIRQSGKRVLLNCHAGCEYDEVVHALDGRENGWRTHAPIIDGSGIEATYDYADEDGELVFQVVRQDGKRFFQRRRVRNRWVNNLHGVPLVLYRLPEVLAAIKRGETIYVPEGEKDADALWAQGYAATCNPMGAGKWRGEYTQALAGAHVVVIADRDERGAQHGRSVKQSLRGVAASVRVVEALTGKDASDHLEAGHTVDEFVPADRFARVDLGAVIANGIEPPAQLIEDALYEGRSHALLGEPGDGKTLVMLAFCVDLMQQGLSAAWFDEENGPSVVAARLVSLGATPEQVTQHFAYYPFTEPTLDDTEELAAEMAALEPVLVVFDSGADMYVAAGLNENDNMDMTRWAQAFSQRLSRAHGIASVVLEHVAKNSDSTYQRGAGAKKAKIDAAWRLEVREPFDHETVGEVQLVRTKDRLAHLPQKLRYRIGGRGDGTTVFERIQVDDDEKQRAADAKAKRDFFAREATAILAREGAFDRERGLSQRQLTGLLSPAPQAFKNEVVQTLAKDPTGRVRSGAGPRNSLIYWVDQEVSND